jgi:hypothetical protein
MATAIVEGIRDPDRVMKLLTMQQLCFSDTRRDVDGVGDR